MRPAFTASKTSVKLRGKAVAGADDRQKRIVGFDQKRFSKSRVLCIGAGGINSQIAPTLARKGIESVYDKVKDGEKIFASTKAEVGKAEAGIAVCA